MWSSSSAARLTSDVLRRAGVARAEVFVACTGLDEVNVVACGMANQLGSPQTICFVSREDFLDVSSRQGALELFGINRVVWPEAQLAEDMERLVVAPGAIDAETFEGGAVRLLEYRLGPGRRSRKGRSPRCTCPADRWSWRCGAGTASSSRAATLS